MPERDGYIPGVPCWVDTSQPDPEAAADLLRRLVRLGVRERACRRTRRRKYLIGRAARRRRRRDRLAARGRRRAGALEHLRLGRQRRRDRGQGADAGGGVVMEPFDVCDAGRMAVFADPEGAAFCVWQARAAPGRAGRQRARLGELQQPAHPRPRAGEGVLRRGLRLGDDRPGGDGVVAAARLRRPPRGARPRAARADGGGRRARRASRTSSPRSTDPAEERTSRRTGASPSASTTPMPSPSGRPSSAARCSWRRSMRHG